MRPLLLAAIVFFAAGCATMAGTGSYDTSNDATQQNQQAMDMSQQATQQAMDMSQQASQQSMDTTMQDAANQQMMMTQP